MAPKSPFIDAKFISVHALAIYDIFAPIGGKLMEVILCVPHIKLVFTHISYSLGSRIPIRETFSFSVLPPYHLTLFEVYQHSLFLAVQQHKWFVPVGEGRVP